MIQLFILLWTMLAQAAETDLCTSPRQSIATLLDNLQPENYHPDIAASCIPADNGSELAIKIQRLLDAKGIFVSYDNLPDDPSYQTEDGKAYIYYEDLSNISVINKDGRWVFTEATIQAVPKLYSETFSTNISAFVKARGGEQLVYFWNAVSKTQQLSNIQALHGQIGQDVVRLVREARGLSTQN